MINKKAALIVLLSLACASSFASQEDSSEGSWNSKSKPVSPEMVGDHDMTHRIAGDKDMIQKMNGNEHIGHRMVNHMHVSAVPETETYAMLVAGLGMLCFVARRKKSL